MLDIFTIIIVSIFIIGCIIKEIWDCYLSKAKKQGNEEMIMLVIELFGVDRAREICTGTVPINNKELKILVYEVNKRWGLGVVIEEEK